MPEKRLFFPAKIVKLFSVVFNPLIEFAAPSHCLICHTKFNQNESTSDFICNSCITNLPLAPKPNIIFNRLVKNFEPDQLSISNADALIEISSKTNFIEVIYGLKYSGFTKLGTELGKLLAQKLTQDNFTTFDFIIPIPIHPAKKRERGFNQSEIIAETLGKELGIPYLFKAVRRSVYTQTQTTLNYDGRQINVKKAFAPGKQYKEISGKEILLIDDVLTTGATLNSCATCLLESGAKKVSVATVALAG